MDVLYCFRPNVEQHSLERVAFFLDSVAADRLQAYFKARHVKVRSDMAQTPRKEELYR